MSPSSGLLLVDKDRGPTSHDVVSRVRRLLNEKRVGHAGTLDPMATGLLVIGVGSSTRLLRFAQAGLKRYEGTVRLGVATDSLDADGAVTAESEVPALLPEDLASAAAAFTGTLSQVPPMVSALKVDGKRLHDLARQGVEVERAAREVTISSLVVVRDDEATLSFDVTCSPGTYVRVLMSDLAERLGTLGHLTSLRRLASGRFRVDDTVTLERLEAELAAGRTPLRPPADFVLDLVSVTLSSDDVRRVRQGQPVTLDEALDGDEIAALDESAALVAVLRRRGTQGRPEIVLTEPPSAQR
ncbi:MAG TPA: tRNA pseudouridine(55) synthase TruB [Acidimicrobiales bacterium]|nr:tRNA pseudouridine(55) synthase TruB [Acidimicrobiales bacterium]